MEKLDLIDKEIAKFMGYELVREPSITGSHLDLYLKKEDRFEWFTRYTKSIDAQIPVWKKLKITLTLHINTVDSSINNCSIMKGEVHLCEAYGSTLALSAAKALYKVILKEINSSREKTT